MRKKHSNEIDPDQFTMLHGKDAYGIDVPDGDLDISIRWYADHNCIVWLNFDKLGEKSVPVLHGVSGNQVVRAKKVVSVEIATDKKATLCACVSYRELNRSDQLDYTPVEITPPPPAQLQMSHLVNEAVMRQLQSMGINPHQNLVVSDEDDLEDEDDDPDEFGPGFMEDDSDLFDETAPTSPQEPPSGPKVAPETSTSPDAESPADGPRNGPDDAPSERPTPSRGRK